MKKKLLFIVLLCLGISVAAQAVEVINIDLNNYGDDTAYTGTAAYNDGVNQWNVYYGGWGKPMGSPRSLNLAAYNEPCEPSTYAAQVWIGDRGVDHNYVSGTALMDDGFVNESTVAGEPNIQLFGSGAYGGTFDIYVYGNEAGSFTVTRGSTVIGTKTVTGGVTAGEFVEGGNYVVFTGVNISSDPNYVLIKYSNMINGLQLVKQKTPVAIQDGTEIGVGTYDVAYETNQRSGETQVFGPDMTAADDYSSYGYLGYLDAKEYMEYDFTMDDGNEGEYGITAYVDVSTYDANYMNVYVNDLSLGTFWTTYTGEWDLASTNQVTVNLFGSSDVQTFKWQMSRAYYHNICYFKFERLGDLDMPDCDAVYKYGFEYTSDLNGDCKVDYKDLAVISEEWLSCIDPNENNCP